MMDCRHGDIFQVLQLEKKSGLDTEALTCKFHTLSSTKKNSGE